MADIFVLHHPTDRELAESICMELARWGLDVGDNPAPASPGQAIGGQAGRAALVIWTAVAANDPDFVSQAATIDAATRVSARFSPARISDIFPEGEIVNVLGWRLDGDHPGWSEMVKRLADRAFAQHPHPAWEPEEIVPIASAPGPAPTIEDPDERATIPSFAIPLRPPASQAAPIEPPPAAEPQIQAHESAVFARLPIFVLILIWSTFAGLVIYAARSL